MQQPAASSRRDGAMGCRSVVRLLAEEKYVLMGSGSDIHIEPEPAPPEGAGANYQLSMQSCRPTRSSCPTGPNQKSALEAQWQRQRAAGGLVLAWFLHGSGSPCAPLVRLSLPSPSPSLWSAAAATAAALLGPGWACLFSSIKCPTPTLAPPGRPAPSSPRPSHHVRHTPFSSARLMTCRSLCI